VKLLLVNQVYPSVRSVATIHKYVATGRALGHEVAVFGTADPELPALSFTTDLNGVDLALFVIQVTSDFPDMPGLARLIDGVPRERRVVVDLWGRFNEPIRLNHDFNHLEKLDGHLGWEWIEAFQAISDTILQPSLVPIRSDVHSFLFHGFDPAAVVREYGTAREAATAWLGAGPAEKPYGVMYVGSNWQRWEQVQDFLKQYAPTRGEVGRACLAGWDWDRRPEWAIQNGIQGVDTDPRLLAELEVETRANIRFDTVIGLLGQARFAPVFHRPLFQHLGFVTNRTFDTFYADTIPVLMLPREFVETILGPAALPLVPEGDIGAHLKRVLNQPEPYWESVLQTRLYLATHHSYEKRFQELQSLLGEQGRLPAGGST